jgi:fumarate hydratase class II
MPMVCIEASDVAVTMGGGEGNFELNAFRPVLISNYWVRSRPANLTAIVHAGFAAS